MEPKKLFRISSCHFSGFSLDFSFDRGIVDNKNLMPFKCIFCSLDIFVYSKLVNNINCGFSKFERVNSKFGLSFYNSSCIHQG